MPPDELAAALPRLLQDAHDRMGKASIGLDRLVREVVSATEMARDQHPPVTSGAVHSVQRILGHAVIRAEADAKAVRERVTARITELSQGRRRVDDAAAIIGRKRRELQEAQDALIAAAREVAAGAGR